jgi:hypothetical protein
MRRSIDDQPISHAGLLEDDGPPDVSWAVGISDDYDDATPRVVLTVEEVGKAGTGLVIHLDPVAARRLRSALRDALRELGEKTEDAVPAIVSHEEG